METGANQKTTFQEILPVRYFVSKIYVILQMQEDVTETSNLFLGKKYLENAVFVGSRFVALGGGSMDKTFSNAKLIQLYTRKL